MPHLYLWHPQSCAPSVACVTWPISTCIHSTTQSVSQDIIAPHSCVTWRIALVVKSLTHGSWSGNIVNRKPPQGGGFLSIKVWDQTLSRRILVWHDSLLDVTWLMYTTRHSATQSVGQEKIALRQRWARQRFTGLCCAYVHIYVLYEYVRMYVYIYEYIKNRATSTLSTSAVHRSFLCVCAYICTIWICTYIYIHLWIYKESRYINAEHVSGSQVFFVRMCIHMYCMNMYVYIYTFMNI